MKVLSMQIGLMGNNCYFLCDEASKRCAVIDPSASGKRIADFAARQGYTIDKIFLTHGHFDHVGATGTLHELFPAVPIYIHAADTDNETNMSHNKLVYTNTYSDGDRLSVGGLTVQVISTPGHTPGSVTLMAEDALFTGDTLFAGSCGRTDFAGGSPDDMAASLRRLGELAGGFTVYPGHAEHSTLSRERETNPYLREAMRR